MKSLKIKLKGMHCVSCAMNIDFDLEDIDGVKKVNTSFAKQETSVEFDESKTNTKEIKAAIEKLGYEVISEE